MRKQLVLVWSASLLVWSCGEPDVEEFETSKEALTFENLNVEPLHGQLDLARQESDAQRVVELYRSASFAQATGSVNDIAYSSEGGCKKDRLEFNPTGFGSGTLTSSSRVTTAHHVVVNMAHNSHVQAVEKYKDRSPALVKFGEWSTEDPYWSAPDRALKTPHITGVLETFFADHHRGEELPWLAGRLFGMGLEGWALGADEPAIRLRGALRVWNFDADEELFSQPQRALSENKKLSKGTDIAFLKAQRPTSPFKRASDQQEAPILVKTPDQIPGQEPKPDEISYLYPGGVIELTRPGAFFGQVPLWNREVYGHEEEAWRCAYEQDRSKKDAFERQRRLYGGYVNNHLGAGVGSLYSDMYYRMVGNPGYPVIPTTPDTLPWSAQQGAFVGGEEHQCVYVQDELYQVLVSYEGAHIDTTLDAVQGFSGGGVYSSTCREYEGGLGSVDPTDLVFKGVMSATGGDTERLSVSNPITRADLGIEEEYLLTQTIVDERKEDEHAEDPTSTVSLLDALALKWASRDEGGQASSSGFQETLVPDQPPTERPSSDCIKEGSSCEKYRGFFATNDHYSQNPSSLREPVLGSEYISADVETGETTESTNPGSSWDGKVVYSTYRLGCFSHGYHKKDESKTSGFQVKGTGFLAGVMGAASDKKLSNTTTLSRIDAICAPWSSASWMSNWFFLERVGRDISTRYKVSAPSWSAPTQAQLVSSASTDSKFYGPFALASTTMTELREVVVGSGKQDQVRPASMKMCPPNYYVKGIDFTVYESGPMKDQVAGITALHCKIPDVYWNANVKEKFPGESIQQELTVKTQAPASGYEYTLNGAPYDLSAWIGDPREASTREGVKKGTAMCEPQNGKPTLASAILVSDSYHSRVSNYISLLCETEPQS